MCGGVSTEIANAVARKACHVKHLVVNVSFKHSCFLCASAARRSSNKATMCRYACPPTPEHSQPPAFSCRSCKSAFPCCFAFSLFHLGVTCGPKPQSSRCCWCRARGSWSRKETEASNGACTCACSVLSVCKHTGRHMHVDAGLRRLWWCARLCLHTLILSLFFFWAVFFSPFPSLLQPAASRTPRCFHPGVAHSLSPHHRPSCPTLFLYGLSPLWVLLARVFSCLDSPFGPLFSYFSRRLPKGAHVVTAPSPVCVCVSMEKCGEI